METLRWRRLAACDSRQQEKGSFFIPKPEFEALVQCLKGKEGENTLLRGSRETAGPKLSTNSEVAGDSGYGLLLGGGGVTMSIYYQAYWYRRLFACQSSR